MNNKTAADTTNEQALDALTDSKLDTVRDILFGAQVRETNQKNEQLEVLIQNTADKLQKNFDKQIQNVNNTISNLKTSLAKQAEQTALDTAKKFNATQANIDELEASTNTKQSDMFDELTAEREALEQRATSWNEDLAKQLENIHQELLHSKTDRSSLANLLSSMAASLSPETHSKDTE
mgnify:CR=1 FL=1